MLVLSMALILVGLLPSPVNAGWLTNTWPDYPAAPGSEAARVLELARAQIGRQFVLGGVGPSIFDCSGLVWFAFKQNGLADRMGGKRRGARGYLNWFRNNLPNQVSPNLADARPGDILIWGGGKHSGLFIGDKWAISALNPRYDIRIHRADRVGLRFTAVLMVDISRTDDGSTPTPSPTPTPTESPSAAPSSAPGG
jgi:cell wall-associated NlpC family hydrolase